MTTALRVLLVGAALVAAWAALRPGRPPRAPVRRWRLASGLLAVALALAAVLGPPAARLDDDAPAPPAPADIPPAPPVAPPPLAAPPVRPSAPPQAPTPAAPAPAPVARVEVRVVDRGSRRAIERAAVWLPGGEHPETTDPDGTAVLPRTPAAATEVVARAPSGAWGRAPLAPEATSVVVEIRDDRRLSGTVTWVTGERAAGYRLRVHGTGAELAEADAEPTPAWSGRRVSHVVETDASGRFVVSGLDDEGGCALSGDDARGPLLQRDGPPPKGGLLWFALDGADELALWAVPGTRREVEFVDDESGFPVGSDLEVRAEWPFASAVYERTAIVALRRAAWSFVWPSTRGAPVPRLAGVATCRGYAETSFVVEAAEDGAHALRVRMRRDGTAQLRVRHPFGPGRSVRGTSFSVYVDDRPFAVGPVGRGMPAAEAPGLWVFAGLPAGRCSIRCHDREIAAATLSAGETATVSALVDAFAEVVLRPTLRGRPVTGPVRLISSGSFPLQVADVDVDPDGTLRLYPLPAGKLVVELSRSTLRSEPPELTVPLTGGGARIEQPVVFVAR